MLYPVVSIIVPCYNQAQYLNECLQSVMDQTYQNWECIIINDGSSDNTEQTIKKWIDTDSRFRYFRKENGGVASARNMGIEKAKGKWILPLDGDDKIAGQYLELAAEKFNENYTLIYCESEFFGTVSEKWNLPEYSFREILFNNVIFCSALFKKADFTDTGGYDKNLYYGLEDWDFWISLLGPDKKVYKLDYTGFYYRRKDESRDTAINADKEKINYSENYIYKKHFEKYTKEFGNFFEIQRKILTLEYEQMRLMQNNRRLNDLANESIVVKIKRKLFK
ncbi:glycosyltransferase family A protein [Chryseobacterium sp. JJR-5R]|uniref:glycosyltransferase family 2 protein n=1 Tax=Chryseobacterium sp. JJR-5R TaxID=3093923 RepID=UPI002A752662|nr:glycosyltransferase family A protein [Chryseobacterium sp. JJR-5R]WPO83076.1 glycosyltransferase family A protein [Chryseobacterium sp. JJR-5R]